MRFYRTKEFKAIYAALESLLCSSSTGGSNGLPVPPLLEIVAEYAIGWLDAQPFERLRL